MGQSDPTYSLYEFNDLPIVPIDLRRMTAASCSFTFLIIDSPLAPLNDWFR